jgi:hypothetical protein
MIVSRKEFKVLQFCSRLSLHVDRPLKRDVVVRAHAGVSRESWINRLEVHEEEGMGERTEFLLQPLSEPGLVSLHRIAGPSLTRRQRIIRRDIVDGADSQFDELSHPQGPYAGQERDMVSRSRHVAVVIEFAGDRIRTLGSRFDLRSLLERQGPPLRVEQLPQVLVELGNFLRQVQDGEKPVQLVAAAVVDVISVEVDQARYYIESAAFENMLLDGYVVHIVVLEGS